MKTINLITVLIAVLAAPCLAAPQIRVSQSPGGVLASGVALVYANAMAGGVSPVLQVDEPAETETVIYSNVPPGFYQFQRADNEEGPWEAISPFLEPTGGTIQFIDSPFPVIVVFYRIVTVEPESLFFVIENTGDADLNLASVTLTGDQADQFLLDDSGLPFNGTLAPDQSAEISVAFLPTEPGAVTADLIIDSNDPGTGSFVIRLEGTAVAAVPGGGPGPGEEFPAFVGLPVITPATATVPAIFSAAVTGPAGAVVKLEVSTDLGLTDVWDVIGQITLDPSGGGAFTDISDPDSIGKPANFYRLRMD